MKWGSQITQVRKDGRGLNSVPQLYLGGDSVSSSTTQKKCDNLHRIIGEISKTYLWASKK